MLDPAQLSSQQPDLTQTNIMLLTKHEKRFIIMDIIKDEDLFLLFFNCLTAQLKKTECQSSLN